MTDNAPWSSIKGLKPMLKDYLFSASLFASHVIEKLNGREFTLVSPVQIQFPFKYAEGVLSDNCIKNKRTQVLCRSLIKKFLLL